MTFMKNKSIRYIASFFIFSICCFVGMWLHFLFGSVVDQDAGYIFELKQGSSRNRVIAELNEQQIIRYPRFFLWYVYPQKNAQVKMGEYFFKKGSTPVSIWKQITTGTGLYLHPFIIIPGWTFNQLKRELWNAEGLRHVSANLSDEQIMLHLGVQNLKPEGEFFPETYYYTKGISDLIILKQAFHDMQKHLSEAWHKRASGLPYKNAYEALIAASLIEKEAYLNKERSTIAGVLVNRLKSNMLLQFDPTVIYGLGERYVGKITKANLLENTIYNTYIHKGLPPTPIAMPSISSIFAALHPEQHPYYYFVAKGDGSHQFSKTLLEHNDAVKALIKWQSEHFNDPLVRRHIEVLLPPVIN